MNAAYVTPLSLTQISDKKGASLQNFNQRFETNFVCQVYDERKSRFGNGKLRVEINKYII